MFVSGVVLPGNIAYSVSAVSFPDLWSLTSQLTLQMSERPWSDDEEDWSETGDDDFDPNDDDSADAAEDDGPDSGETVSCPSCHADVYADLDDCPRCGHWFTDADRAVRETGLFATRRVRMIAAALLAVFVFSLLAELVLFG